MIRKVFLAAAALACLLCAPLVPAAPGDASWDTHVAQFVESYFAANPSAAVYAGRHEFDGHKLAASRAFGRGHSFICDERVECGDICVASNLCISRRRVQSG